MSSLYTELQGIANDILEEFKQGTVTLTRKVNAASEVSTPWLPGTETLSVYTLNAVVRGVTFQHIDGTLILAGDLIVTCAVKATLAGADADVVPQMNDALTIGGKSHAIKKIEPKPATGTPVAYLIFVAG